MFDTPIEKGLFTFYREQQQLEENSKKMMCSSSSKKQKQNNQFLSNKSLYNKKRSKLYTNSKDQISPFNFNKRKKDSKKQDIHRTLKQSQKQLLKYQTTYLKAFQDIDQNKSQSKKKSTKVELNEYIKTKMAIHNMRNSKKLIIQQKREIKPHCFRNSKLKFSFSLPSIAQTQNNSQKQQNCKAHFISHFDYSGQKTKNQNQKQKKVQTEFCDQQMKKRNSKNYIKYFKKRWSSFSYRQNEDNDPILLTTPMEKNQSLLISQNQKNNDIFKECTKNQNKKLRFHAEIQNNKLQLVQLKQTIDLQGQSSNINIQDLVNTYKLKMSSQQNVHKNNRQEDTNYNHCRNAVDCNKHAKLSLLKHIRKYPAKKFQQLNQNSKSIFLICESLGLNQKNNTINSTVNPQTLQ